MNRSIFLDTCIFFECLDDTRKQSILNHTSNCNYSIQTSITVLGEFFDKVRSKPDQSDTLLSVFALLRQWNVTALYPDDPVRILCFELGDDEIDTRMIREKTDRVHLAYAMSYGCTYFITSDSYLIKYRVPKLIEDKGFSKPITLTLEDFKKLLH